MVPGHGPGETATFMHGTLHKFWNAGEDELPVKGWINPANNVEYFSEGVYKALDEGNNNCPKQKGSLF